MGSSLSLGGKAAQKGWYVNQASKNESLSFLELGLLLNISHLHCLCWSTSNLLNLAENFCQIFQDGPLWCTYFSIMHSWQLDKISLQSIALPDIDLDHIFYLLNKEGPDTANVSSVLLQENEAEQFRSELAISNFIGKHNQHPSSSYIIST